MFQRRSSKRLERQDVTYGQDTEAYEAIRQRVLQERAVVNAIDALQERWRMLTFMFTDCEELNQTRKDRQLKKLCTKRQFELISIIVLFTLFCLPMFLIGVLLFR